jgi:hypothetical protein
MSISSRRAFKLLPISVLLAAALSTSAFAQRAGEFCSRSDEGETRLVQDGNLKIRCFCSTDECNWRRVASEGSTTRSLKAPLGAVIMDQQRK